MKRTLQLIAAATFATSVVACSDTSSLSDGAFDASDLSAAFNFTPTGFSSTENSFVGNDSTFGAHGEDHHHGGPGRRGPGIGGLMGGGLHDLFRGAGFGPGFGHGHRGVEHCDNETRNGLTISCTVAYATAAGATQTAFDSITTDRITTHVSVTGTLTRRDSSTTTVNNISDRTVSGLAKGSTARTVNGAALGNEQTAGKDTAGTFSVKRVVGDTVKAVVIPMPTATDSVRPFPRSGTVIRSHSVTVTRASGTTTSTRREVVTYDGSTTAKVTITENGTTKSCTVALPHGKLQCS